MGFLAHNIHIVANDNFLQNNRPVRRLFEIMSIPPKDVAEQNSRMRAGQDTRADVERHAQEWIASNREQVDKWLREVRGAEVESGVNK